MHRKDHSCSEYLIHDDLQGGDFFPFVRDGLRYGDGAGPLRRNSALYHLGGMDEAHGQWGQMGVEIALKAWLSGGRQIVNKKTWFAHYFRGGSGPGFPWPASGKKQEDARQYSIKFWTEGKWDKQVRDLDWLVAKSWPLPGWRKPVAKVWIPKDDRKIKPWSQEYARSQLKGPIEAYTPALRKSITDPQKDKWFVKLRRFNVEQLFNNRLSYARESKLEGIRWQIEVIPPLVKRILDGETFTDEQIKQLDYYHYLTSRLNPLVHPPSGPTPKGVKHCVNQVKDLIRLCYSMRDEGLKSPFDMFIDDTIEVDGEKRDKLILIRGGRRLPIAYHLGWKKVPVRIWRTEHLSQRFIPTNAWPDEKDTITEIAARQFLKHKEMATDKYYRHGYTYLYDTKFKEYRKMSLKILELGVKSGASLQVWEKA